MNTLRHKRSPLVGWPDIATSILPEDSCKEASQHQPGSALAYCMELMLPACGVLATEAVCASYPAGALKAWASSQTVSITCSEGSLPVLLQQNLARVLVRAGRLQEAVGLYEHLQAEGEQPQCALHSCAPPGGTSKLVQHRTQKVGAVADCW